MIEPLGVFADSVSYSYFNGLTQVPVLDHFNIKVPIGTIYGLLGPSGCGKTTFLKCVLGRQVPDFGQIRLFGWPAGCIGNNIPGPGIGYMPQELAVQDDMTIREILFYFGRINFVDVTTLKKRIDSLIMTLNLPEKNRIIRSLSGGQKRRVSFAISVIHKPKLLILDEPTVGVDPILRKTIWEQLVQFSVKDRISIIVTTHYIEETKRANFVGFMNKGRLLYQGTPEESMRKFNVDSLEKVFYQLCLHGSNDEATNEIKRPTLDRFKVNPLKNRHPMATSKLERLHNWFFLLTILIQKILLQTKRNPGALICQFVIPFVTIAIVFSCFGTIPHHLPVYIVNEENPPDLSKLFLDSVNKYDYIIDETYFNDFNSAMSAARKYKAAAVVHIKPNFSEALALRADIDNELTSQEIEEGSVRIHSDIANSLVHLFVTRIFEQSFLDFLAKLKDELNTSSMALELPLKAENFQDIQIEDLVLPTLVGFMVLVIYSTTFSVTIFVVLTEKLDKIFDRNYAAGISPTQIVFAHLISRFVYSCITTLLIYFFTIHIYEINHKGSVMLGLALVVSIAFTALCHGMATSAIFNNYFFCCSVAQGAIVGLFIIGGVVWPIEAMPYWIRPLAYLSPVQAPTEALKVIVLKGYTLNSDVVFQGFFMSGSWSFLFLAFSILVLHHTM